MLLKLSLHASEKINLYKLKCKAWSIILINSITGLTRVFDQRRCKEKIT